jgi:hypothetical protein
MNTRTGGTRLLRRGGALAVAAGVAVLITACGVVHVHFGSSGGSASTGSATYRADLAFAHCMQTHGVPNFPNPTESSSFHVSGHLNGKVTGPMARALGACQHLLPRSATAPAMASPPGAVSADCLASRPPCYGPWQLRVARMPRSRSVISSGVPAKADMASLSNTASSPRGDRSATIWNPGFYLKSL